MPRWKALPDDLDPQIREFAGQLRRLVDRSDLSVAALADATGYSKTSWEKYLNGRLLAPKGAVVALAEVTETDPVHLTTMWELAERAWSRAEMRHDRTIEAIRISQARAALGEPGGGRNETEGGRAGPGPTRPTGPAGPGPAGPTGPGPTGPGSAAAGPASPPVPSRPTAADSADSATGRDGAVRDRGPAAASPGPGPAAGESAPVNSWGLAGYRGPAPSGPRRGGAVPGRDATVAFGGPPAAPGRPRPSVPGGPRPSVPGSPYGTPSAPYGTPPPPYGGGPHGTPPPAPRPRRGPAGKRTAMFAAGVVGVLGVLAGAFFLLHDGGEKENEGAKPSPSPTATARKSLPPGVKCSGDQCTGKDAEAMGCGGDLVTTEQSVTVGTTLVEVRYSKVCGAVWGRVTQAAPGDEVEVSAGKAKQTGSVTTAGDTIAYTPMVAVPDAADATACVTLASGEKGCTP
ncbi:helix-turn-helix domain-containing protein [Streptomyces fumanus]|uniref:HTH cro/C1-type domain-containing protein n=1 Tax=Streptomyces fumanus TaxID=67302 RepID=A0A919E2N1_9ACTN|nr:XRE family transcriptional regulator [Streptomyces fumanus]GHF13335.1 hypothetical protein GCM10018772_43130 [Streptomyces fumanus]